MMRLRFLALCAPAAFAAVPLAHDDDPKLLDAKPRYEGKGYRRDAHLLPAMRTAGPGTSDATAIDFPASGVHLLSWMPLPEFGSHATGNDCWGYVSPSGREYAIIGVESATGFVEITDPGDAQLISVQSGPTSLWRDVKVYQNYAYAVSEGGSGIQVFNLANIDAGVVTHVTDVTAGGDTTATHNVVINEDSGYLYRAGGGDHGLRFYSLANPASPSYVGAWNQRYSHDAQVVTYTSGPYAGREIAYSCGGFDGGFTSTGLSVIDVTNKSNPITLANESYSSPAYSHQAWLSDDRNYLFLNDELDETGSNQGRTIVFNVSDPGNPFQATTYTHGNTAVTHNLYVDGNRTFHSNYTAGLQIFDNTNPLSPVETGFFDTAPDSETVTYNGLWSNYPYFPSGVVIGSDLERGLFVWWIGTPQLSFGFPQGTPEFIAPDGTDVLRVDVSETGGTLNGGSVRLHYNAGSGWQVLAMSGIGGGSYEASLPPIECGTALQYYVSGESSTGITWSSPGAGPTAPYLATAALSEIELANHEMETNAGWTGGVAGDDATTGIWERGEPVGTGAQPETDHTPSGTDCWVTGNLDGPFGVGIGDDDVDGGVTTLRSPAFALAGANGAIMSYWRWFSNDQGSAPNEDILEVQISSTGGAPWTTVEIVGPTGPEASAGWYQHQFNVEDFVPLTNSVRLRFRASDEGSGSIVEAAIDDLRIVEVVCEDCDGNGIDDAVELAGGAFDLDGDGTLDVCQPLSADAATVDLSSGGTQNLHLAAGSQYAGELYWLVGSVSGTSPGLPAGSLTLPLNPDFYFNLTFANPNNPPLANSLSFLNGSGEADASFSLPSGTSASLAGITAHHAYAVIVDDEAVFVSNAIPVDLVN